MDDAVGSPGVVRGDLPDAFANEGHPYLPDPAIDDVQPGDRLLVTSQQRVPALQHAGRQRTPLGDVLPEHLAGGGLVFQQPGDHPVGEVLKRVRANDTRETFGDQLLGHAAFERIESFYLAGLDGEGAVSFCEPRLDEAVGRVSRLRLRARLEPLALQHAALRVAPVFRAVGQAFQRLPDFRVFVHAGTIVPHCKRTLLRFSRRTRPTPSSPRVPRRGLPGCSAVAPAPQGSTIRRRPGSELLRHPGRPLSPPVPLA